MTSDGVKRPPPIAEGAGAEIMNMRQPEIEVYAFQ